MYTIESKKYLFMGGSVSNGAFEDKGKKNKVGFKLAFMLGVGEAWINSFFLNIIFGYCHERYIIKIT